jgi:predicted phage-related endonuclease
VAPWQQKPPQLLFMVKEKAMNRKELKKKIARLEEERKEILYSDYKGKDAEYAAIAMSDIEFKIVALEDMLDFERRMLPFKIMLYGFIVVALGLLLWAFLVKK